MSKSEIMIDNNVTRVTKWSFLPGEDTGQHIHHYDYVVVPIIDGKLIKMELKQYLNLKKV